MPPRELTARGLVLGALICTIFTAANVYLGLKVGLTFASSIPAAVISMAILSLVKDSSILENNIVQTVASAAGTLSAIIFVLPGLVIVGWWTGFPFWLSSLVCLAGGVLGVLFTIPLRRALVTTSDLPYPEGVAAAEVLKVGSGTRGDAGTDAGEAREGLVAVVLGSVASAGLAIFTATRVAAASVSSYIAVTARVASGYDVAFSLALFGAGHLVGPVGRHGDAHGSAHRVDRRPPDPDLAPVRARRERRLRRTPISCGGARSASSAPAPWASPRSGRWRSSPEPVVSGFVSTIASARTTATEDERDRDLSPGWIVGLSIACLALSGWLAFAFIGGTPLESHRTSLVIFAVPFTLLGGFLIAGICGYMAGLIGASNSPISGVGILSIVACASVLVVAVKPGAGAAAGAHRLRALRHRHRLCLRHDLERQPAGSQDRPAGRRRHHAASRSH